MQNTCMTHVDGSERVWRLWGDTDEVHPSIHPLPPPQWVNDHRPPCITVLCNSNSSSFPAAGYVALKVVFMKVSVFLMSAPFDNSLSAELAGRQTAILEDIFFWLALPLPLFICYLLVCHYGK